MLPELVVFYLYPIEELAKVFEVTTSSISRAIKKIQEVMPPQELSDVIALLEITSESNFSGHKTVIKYRRRILTHLSSVVMAVTNHCRWT
jgi:transcriptional antiterminator